MSEIYHKVVNGEIVEYSRTLPFTSGKTRFESHMTREEMRRFDYVPEVGSFPTLTPTQRVSNVGYVVGADEVTKVYDVVEVTEEELFKATVPQTITPRQFRLALLQATLLDEVELMANADKAMSIWFEYSLDIRRDSEFIVSGATSLGLTERQIDELFILGATL